MMRSPLRYSPATTCLAFAIVGLWPGVVRSQSLTPAGKPAWFPAMTAGAPLRVSVDSPLVTRLQGAYRDADQRALHLTVRNSGAMAIPYRRIVYVETSEGRQRLRWAFKGAYYGLAVGAVAGALLGERDDPGGVGGIAGMIGGGIAGLPVGAIAGAIWAPQRWRRHGNWDR